MDALVDKEILVLEEDELVINNTVIMKYGKTCTTLTIKCKKIIDLDGLLKFENLHTLILDNCNIFSIKLFPRLEQLKTLWLNHNDISDLLELSNNLNAKFPRLQHISLMFNKEIWPHLKENCSKNDIVKYRQILLYKNRQLNIIDDEIVTDDEYSEALKRGEHLTRVSKPIILTSSKETNSVVNILEKKENIAPNKIKKTTNNAVIFKSKKLDGSFNQINSEGNRFIKNSDL
jgi:hypothetical protein